MSFVPYHGINHTLTYGIGYIINKGNKYAVCHETMENMQAHKWNMVLMESQRRNTKNTGGGIPARKNSA
jgi:hypothetical protein